MTIGERNRVIIRMYNEGNTEKSTAEYVGTTENVVSKVISSYRKDGDKIFESTKSWDGSDDDVMYMDAISQKERNEIESLRYGKKLEMRRLSIRKGQNISFLRDGRILHGEVLEEPRDWEHVILVRVNFLNGNSYKAAPMIDDIVRADKEVVEVRKASVKAFTSMFK